MFLHFALLVIAFHKVNAAPFPESGLAGLGKVFREAAANAATTSAAGRSVASSVQRSAAKVDQYAAPSLKYASEMKPVSLTPSTLDDIPAAVASSSKKLTLQQQQKQQLLIKHKEGLERLGKRLAEEVKMNPVAYEAFQKSAYQHHWLTKMPLQPMSAEEADFIIKAMNRNLDTGPAFKLSRESENRLKKLLQEDPNPFNPAKVNINDVIWA